MSTYRHVVQDRRSVSRLSTKMECLLKFGGAEHKATLGEVSLENAFLWSTIIPPQSSKISIVLESPLWNARLILDAKVVRHETKFNGMTTRKAFAVRFNNKSSDLIRLIREVVSKASQNQP